MAGILAFPAIHQVLIDDKGPVYPFLFSEAAKAGMNVGFAAAGISKAVVPMDGTAGEQPIGSAIYDVAAGDMGAVAMDGCIVIMANDDDTNTIDAGDHVGPLSSTVQGAVVTIALGIQAADIYYSGKALEDIGPSSTGEVLIDVGVFLDGTG